MRKKNYETAGNSYFNRQHLDNSERQKLAEFLKVICCFHYHMFTAYTRIVIIIIIIIIKLTSIYS